MPDYIHIHCHMLIVLPPLEYSSSGFVSEKTDAFALGIVLVELLTANTKVIDRTAVEITLDARSLVDIEGDLTLSAVLEARARDAGWTGAAAEQAAKELSGVAASCIGNTSRRQTPSQVLPLLEAASSGVWGGLSGAEL
jgi:hypothetical protein